MKRILSLILLVSFLLCGCSYKNNTPKEETKIVINLPKDNTVNGYRTDKVASAVVSMPDKIKAEDTAIAENETNANNGISKELCGNKNSKVFHSSSCGSVTKMKDNNKIYFKNRNEFISNGYKPCSRCNP